MEYTLRAFWEGEKHQAVAPLWPPLTLKFDSIDEMRTIVKKLADHAAIPAHSFSITAEDGTVERWFKLAGEWRRKDA